MNTTEAKDTKDATMETKETMETPGIETKENMAIVPAIGTNEAMAPIIEVINGRVYPLYRKQPRDQEYFGHDKLVPVKRDEDWEREHNGLKRQFVYTAVNLARNIPIRRDCNGSFRNMWQCFGFGQRIRHVIEVHVTGGSTSSNSTCRSSSSSSNGHSMEDHVIKKHIWVGRYNPNEDTICMSESEIFQSPTSFARAHYGSLKIVMSKQLNGWNECEYDIDGRSLIDDNGKAQFLNDGDWKPIHSIQAPVKLLPLPANW